MAPKNDPMPYIPADGAGDQASGPGLGTVLDDPVPLPYLAARQGASRSTTSPRAGRWINVVTSVVRIAWRRRLRPRFSNLSPAERVRDGSRVDGDRGLLDMGVVGPRRESCWTTTSLGTRTSTKCHPITLPGQSNFKCRGPMNTIPGLRNDVTGCTAGTRPAAERDSTRRAGACSSHHCRHHAWPLAKTARARWKRRSPRRAGTSRLHRARAGEAAEPEGILTFSDGPVTA